MVFTVHKNGIVELGADISVEQATAFFWRCLEFDGKSLVEQRDEALLLLEESREDVIEEQEFDTYREER
jgi:hypothetical protein